MRWLSQGRKGGHGDPGCPDDPTEVEDLEGVDPFGVHPSKPAEPAFYSASTPDGESARPKLLNPAFLFVASAHRSIR